MCYKGGGRPGRPRREVLEKRDEGWTPDWFDDGNGITLCDKAQRRLTGVRCLGVATMHVTKQTPLS